MRVAYYAGVSTAAAAVCLLKAFHERPNFYSATVYLSQSSACLLILTNFLLLCACSFVYTLQRLFYGPLRPIEIEQLSERAWYAVLDTLLAMPSFREDVGGWLLVMFVLLLTGKVWGWIGEGRVDIFEQQPPLNPRLFHARLASSLLLSVLFDICMLKYCLDVVVKPGMMVIFTFEFAILLVFSTFTLGRYILNIISNIVQKRQVAKAIELRKLEIKRERLAAQQAAEQESEGQPSSGQEISPDEPIEVDENEVDVPGWEDKRRYLFGLEMTADLVKLTLYIVFFTVSVMFNGLPMHIIRDVYMTFTSFTKRLSDYINWRKATSDMNDRYPDATEAEIRGDSCIVCRDDMHPWAADAVDTTGQAVYREEGSRPKKLPCGHILHMRCLKAWLERQQVCPTCRRPVVSAAAAAGVNAAAAPEGARRPAGLNRARFFNLGPLRVGFLNGAAQDVDNVVNQLRGVQPQAPPPAQPQRVELPGDMLTGARVQLWPPPPPPPGISQDEIEGLSRRILHEASQLNVHQSQLVTIRSMVDELNRLRAMSQGNNEAGQQFSESAHPPSNYLRGFPAQELRSGDPALPRGLTLPEGWSLMPLRPAAHAPIAAGLHQPSASVVHPQPTYPAQNTAPLRSSSPNVPADNAVAQPPPVEGSPLFTVTPAATTSVESTIADTATSSALPAQESGTTVRRPWATEGWDFDSAQPEDTAHGEKQDKGKGKAVAIEDVPDSEA